MLPPHIIEEIRRREKAERRRPERQPQIELPTPVRKSRPPVDEDSNRGIVIIDLM